MVGIDPERVSTAGRHLRQNVATLDDIEVDIRVALTRSGMSSPVLATVDDVGYELSSLDQILQTRTNLALGFQLTLGPARLTQQTSQLWNHLLDPSRQTRSESDPPLRFQLQDNDPGAEHNPNNPIQDWDSTESNGGSPDETSTNPWLNYTIATGSGAVTGAPGFYADKYDDLIYTKGNGNIAWQNRIDGPDGRKLTAAQRALRTAAYGDTVEEGASRVRIASLGKVLSWAGTGWDFWGNYQENNREGRNDAIVIIDTIAETAVKAGAGAAGTYAGCTVGTALGTSLAGPVAGGVGCFVLGTAGGTAGSLAADHVYDSLTEDDSEQDKEQD